MVTAERDAGLQELERSYTEMLALCATLENIADSLPQSANSKPDRQAPTRVLTTMLPLIDRTHALEERFFFPELRQSASVNADTVIGRLRTEHRHDREVAEHIVRTLSDLLDGRCLLSRDAVGYMLRGFFENLRRHVSAEQDILRKLRGRPMLH